MKEQEHNRASHLRAAMIPALLILAIFTAASAAQALAQPAAQAETKSALNGRSASGGRLLAAGDEDYRIGINDVLDIKVENAPELTGEYRVTSGGTLYRVTVAEPFAAPDGSTRIVYVPVVGSCVRSMNAPLVLSAFEASVVPSGFRIETVPLAIDTFANCTLTC